MLFFLPSIEPKKKGRITLINNFEEPEDCPQTLETLLEKIDELNKKEILLDTALLQLQIC